MRHIQEANFLLEQRMLTERTERILSEQTSDIIKQAQKILKVNPDGIIGNNTKTAILNYQKQNNLMATGILDDKTLIKMGLSGNTTQRTTIPSGNLPSTTQTTTLGR